MASAGRLVAIAGGASLLVAVGGGGTYLLLKQPPSTFAETTQVAAPAKPADPAAGASESTPDIATVDFAPTKAEFTIAKPTAAYISASTDSPRMYALPPGVGVQATEQSKDGKWLIALTEDGQAAFLPSSDLGPYQESAASQVPSLPDTISGAASVIDTATLSVDGQQVSLFGVIGETGAAADGLQDLLNAHGSHVTCQLQQQSYKCLLPGDTDIGRVALFNGAAKPGPDASEDYRQQAAAAQAARKGVWQ